MKRRSCQKKLFQQSKVLQHREKVLLKRKASPQQREVDRPSVAMRSDRDGGIVQVMLLIY